MKETTKERNNLDLSFPTLEKKAYEILNSSFIIFYYENENMQISDWSAILKLNAILFKFNIIK